MASYVGDYTNEFGFVYKQILLPVFQVSQAQGKLTTTQEFDSSYLPNIFTNNVVNFVKGFVVCQAPVILRYALFWLNADSYLHVPIPFRQGSTNFNQFLIEAKFNLSITTVGTRGERINPSWVKQYATKYS